MDKRGEMPWWLVLFVLAILFLATMSYIQGGIVKKSLKSINLVQDDTDKQADCLVIFDPSNDRDGDGWRDGDGCDECPDDPARHDGECA